MKIAAGETGLRVLAYCPMNPGHVSGSRIRAILIFRGLASQGVRLVLVAPGASGLAANWLEDSLSAGDRERLVDQLVAAACDFRADVLYGITEGNADLVLEASRRLGLPCVFDVHGIGVVEILELGRGYGPRLRRLRSSLRNLRALRGATALTVANPTLLPVLRAVNTSTRLAPGLVDTELFTPNGTVDRRVPEDTVHVLYAGNRLPWQGCDLLLDAAARMEDGGRRIQVTVVASDADGGPNLPSRHDLPRNAEVVASVEHHEMPPLLRGADILVVPRPWMLSTYLAFPCKLTEFMAIGRAVLATNLKPHRYAIEDGATGILCRMSSAGLAAGIERLFSAALRDALGRQARAAAEARFDYRQGTLIIRDVLRSVVGNG